MHYMYMPPQCRLVRAAPSGAHDHVVTAYTGVSPVSQLFHGVPHPAFTPSTALKPRAAIAYVTQALGIPNVWRTATRRALAALPISSATRRFPRTKAQGPGRHFTGHVGTLGAAARGSRGPIAVGAPPYAHAACAPQRASA